MKIKTLMAVLFLSAGVTVSVSLTVVYHMKL